MTIREWWNAKACAAEQESMRQAAAANERAVSTAQGLQGLSDNELIGHAQSRSTLSHPYHEMEMQRRLKDAIEKLTTETKLARLSSDRWSLIIAVLTVVIVALTVVLALKA